MGVLDGQAAIVTGGGQGVGRGVALAIGPDRHIASICSSVSLRIDA